MNDNNVLNIAQQAASFTLISLTVFFTAVGFFKRKEWKKFLDKPSNETLTTKTNELQEALTELVNVKTKELQELIDTLKKQGEVQNSQINNLKTSNEENQKRVSEQDTTILNLKARIGEMHVQIDEINKQLDAEKKMRVEAETRASKLAESVEILTRQNETSNIAVQALTNALTRPIVINFNAMETKTETIPNIEPVLE